MTVSNHVSVITSLFTFHAKLVRAATLEPCVVLVSTNFVRAAALPALPHVRLGLVRELGVHFQYALVPRLGNFTSKYCHYR